MNIHYLSVYNPVREDSSPENQLALQPASLWKLTPKHLPHGVQPQIQVETRGLRQRNPRCGILACSRHPDRSAIRKGNWMVGDAAHPRKQNSGDRCQSETHQVSCLVRDAVTGLPPCAPSHSSSTLEAMLEPHLLSTELTHACRRQIA